MHFSYTQYTKSWNQTFKIPLIALILQSVSLKKGLLQENAKTLGFRRCLIGSELQPHVDTREKSKGSTSHIIRNGERILYTAEPAREVYT